MMLSHHVDDRPRKLHVAQHVDAGADVRSDQREFLRTEPARPREDIDRNRDLADIVHQSAEVNPLGLMRVQLEALRQNARQMGNPALMARGIRVSLIDRGGNSADGLRQRLAQALLGAPTLGHVGNDAFQVHAGAVRNIAHEDMVFDPQDFPARRQ